MPTRARPKRGFISARVSTDDQNAPGRPSIPAQIEAMRALAARLGVPVADDDIFIDDETGQIVNRPELARALARLDLYTHALFYDATRVGRSRRVSSAIRAALDDAGVQLRLVHGDTAEMDDVSRVILESVLDGVSEAEIVQTVQRTSIGRRARALRGLPPTTMPACYLPIRDSQGRSVGGELDPAWRETLDAIARLFLDRTPYVEMAMRLPPRPDTGKRWDASSLRWLILNPVLRGRVPYGRKRRQIEFTADSILPQAWPIDTAVAIEAEIARRRANAKSLPHTRAYLYSGVLRCGECGHLLTGTTTSRGKLTVYVCAYNYRRVHGYSPGEPHPTNISHERDITAALQEWIESLSVEKLDAYLDAYTLTLAPPPPDDAERLGIVLSEIVDLEDELARVRAPVARAALEAELARLREQSALLGRETARAEGGPPDPEQLRGMVVHLREHAADLFDASPDELRAALRRAFPALYVWRGQIVTPVPVK